MLQMPPPTTNATNVNIVSINITSIIALNTQIFTKLTTTNYTAWRVQMNALLVGYDLIGFVDGTNRCPSPSHRDYNYWPYQDQLILHAIISSIDQHVGTMLGNVKTFKQAWDILIELLVWNLVMKFIANFGTTAAPSKSHSGYPNRFISNCVSNSL